MSPLLFFVLACSACAPPRLYADPAGNLDAYARISIRNAAPEQLFVRLYDDAATCSGRVKLFEDEYRPLRAEPKAVYAKKGEPFTITGYYLRFLGNTSRTCGLNATFVPTAASYQVVYSADASVESCGVVPFEGEGRSARPIAPERLVLRRNLAQSFSGAWCEALADEQRAALGMPKPAAPK